MLNALKRYSMALVFLVFVIFLMVLGTMGVTKFGNQMIEDTGQINEMKPRGEKLKL